MFPFSGVIRLRRRVNPTRRRNHCLLQWVLVDPQEDPFNGLAPSIREYISARLRFPRSRPLQPQR